MPSKFFDAHIRPPRGGWYYVVGGRDFQGYNESDLVAAIKKWRVNNGTYAGDDAIVAEIWDYFGRREPERLGVSAIPILNAPEPLPSSLVPAEKTPERQGPPIWLFLNTLAAQWNPALHDYFLATCDAILSILDCPDCRGEWSKLLVKFPPAQLNTRYAVCQWVNLVHNEVNDRKGRRAYPYASMVTEFGAPATP